VAGGAPTWMRGTPGHGTDAAENPAGNAFAISGPTGYIDNMDATLVSPKVTVDPGNTVIQWWMRLDTEAGYDTLAAEWSSDGSTWQTLGTFSGKNPGVRGWSRYALPFNAPGGPVQVRFHFVSDSLCSGLGGPVCSSTTGWDGVHVDDVVVGKPAA
jgi:hypothetical protein